MTPTWAIETENLTKTFHTSASFNQDKRKPVTVVDQVSFKIAQGEIVGLMGPNGAGKTTLLKILATLISPDHGAAKINGYDLNQTVEIKRNIGLVVPDERSFYWRLTGRQNLSFFCALYGYFGQKRETRVTELLNLVDLTQEADTRFDRYSSGMKQRLALARGMIHQPTVLFLDEPGRALDQTQKERLHDHIATLNQRDRTTILMITHDPSAAANLCHRTLYMEKGRMKGE